MQKITPCLTFHDKAEEAARFYTSVFKNSKIGTITHYGEAAAKASGRPKGSVMTVAFELDGQDFLALNGGPGAKFSPAISLMVNCANQQELDEMWEKLSAGGKTSVCSWLEDKFGVSWQIVPASLGEMMKDPKKLEKVMEQVIQMTKLDIGRMQKAYEEG